MIGLLKTGFDVTDSLQEWLQRAISRNVAMNQSMEYLKGVIANSNLTDDTLSATCVTTWNAVKSIESFLEQYAVMYDALASIYMRADLSPEDKASILQVLEQQTLTRTRDIIE